MARYHTPIRIMVFDDLVAFLVPRLKDTVGDLLNLMNAGHHEEQESSWHIYTWEGERHGVVLEARQGDLSFSLVLNPGMWEHLPAIINAKTIGIIVDRQYWHDEEGSVDGLIMTDDEQLQHTMYKVFNVDRGLKTMPTTLKDIKQTWNPNGVLTYLLHILGEPLEVEAG